MDDVWPSFIPPLPKLPAIGRRPASCVIICSVCIATRHQVNEVKNTRIPGAVQLAAYKPATSILLREKNIMVLFISLIIRIFQFVFVTKTVFFSHNKSVGTVFQIVFSGKRMGFIS